MKDHSKNKAWRVGQVKFFNNDKGFGFVECWDDGQEYFFHVSKIDTKPIVDSDYVIFRLELSVKKPGTLEARNLSLASKFSQDSVYLREQFLKHSNEYFRKSILLSLPPTDILDLLKEEITEFQNVDSEEEFSSFTKITRFYHSLNTSQSLKSKISSIISSQAEQIALGSYKIKFWLDGILIDQPDIEFLQNHFEASEKKERLAILKRADNSSRKKIIEGFIIGNEPQDVLNLILDHLKQINNLGYYTDIKSKLYEKDFWKDKLDYVLFETTIKYMDEMLDDRKKMSLFFNGYMNSSSSEYILSACLEFSQKEIDQIIRSQILSETDAFNLIDKLLSKKIDSFWETKNFSNQENAIISDSNGTFKYDEGEIKWFGWVFDIAREHLTEFYYAKIECLILERMPNQFLFFLWESGRTIRIPHEIISNYLITAENSQVKVDQWLRFDKITKDEIINILRSNIQNQKGIESRKEFYVLMNHLQALISLRVDLTVLESIPASNICFYKLAMWLEGISDEFNFNDYKTKLVFLSPDDQIKFLRKIFWLKHTSKFDLTVEKLNELIRIDFDLYSLNQKYHPDVLLDISVHIVLEAIKSFVENGKFLFESDLLTILFKNLTSNKSYKFKIKELFESCSGRSNAEFYKGTRTVKKIPFETNRFYFALEFEYDEQLVEKIKQLPGRKWIKEQRHWGVPYIYEEQVVQFALANGFSIDYEGSTHSNNTHLVRLKRTEKVPNGVTFCEGRLAEDRDRTFNRKFWWCCNQPCFQNCETIHDAENWKEYTLLDFLSILGLNLDDTNRLGDYIENGKYHQFISTINRFNRLLERMYCEGCGQILFPVEDSHFAHYRVVRFHCENTECSKLHYEIYLHHCLNGKCNSIIDSRKSKKCANGLYICSNKNCGCCCSHEMLSRRYQNLLKTGGHIHGNLKYAVENKLGHLERAEHFCYQCGKLMNELGKDVFQCQTCNIQYDVSRNKFKRPHRHLGQNPNQQSTDSFRPDDYPF